MKAVNNRQFIIMKAKYEDAGFEHVQLSCGLFLSYQKNLSIKTYDDKVLLGNAFHCKKTGDIVLDDASLSDMRNWAGRWILISGNELYMDACGTLGVFYGYDESGSPVCSSSIALASEMIPGAKWNSDFKIDRGNPPTFDFYPGPCTPVDKVRALLPSEYLDLSEGKAKRRSDFDFTRYKNLSREELQKKFTGSAETVLKNIEKQYAGHMWLPLTGGTDSRTLFALLKGCGADFKCYTIKRPDTKAYDMEIPESICRKSGITHEIFTISEPEDKALKAQREEELEKHCGGRTTRGTEIGQYISGIDVPDADNAVILWGTVWEMGARFYYNRVDQESIYATDLETIRNAMNKISDGIWRSSSVHVRSLEEWSEKAVNEPYEGLNWVDRMYWEQRVGAWVKYSYQAYDLFDSLRISPVNCQSIIELMVSYNSVDPSKHFKKDIQKSVITDLCPELSDIPYGKAKKSFAKRVSGYIKRRLNKLKYRGFKNGDT